MPILIDEEKSWIEGLKRGEETAFKKIFDKYRDKLFSYCYRFTKSEELAEEIVHDVLVKVWLQREQLDKSLSFGSFLYTITHNAALNFLRKVAADKSLKKRASLFLEHFRNETEQTIQASDLERITSEAIQSLPPQRKLIFEMSRYEELTHEEIAAQLGISKHTVRNQIVEATKFVKEYLRVHADITLGLCFIAFLL